MKLARGRYQVESPVEGFLCWKVAWKGITEDKAITGLRVGTVDLSALILLPGFLWRQVLPVVAPFQGRLALPPFSASLLKLLRNCFCSNRLVTLSNSQDDFDFI